MDIRVVEQTDALTHVALSGRLDGEAVQLAEGRFHLATAGRRAHTVVDISAVTFLSSTGMRMLLTVAKALHGQGYKLVLLRPQHMPELGLKAAGLETLLPIAHAYDQALALLHRL